GLSESRLHLFGERFHRPRSHAAPPRLPQRGRSKSSSSRHYSGQLGPLADRGEHRLPSGSDSSGSGLLRRISRSKPVWLDSVQWPSSLGFKPLRIKSQGPCILGYYPNDVVRDAFGYARLDLQRDLYIGTYQPGEMGEHLVCYAARV